MKGFSWLAGAIILAASSPAQTPAPAFEVASVKHSSGGGPPGDIPRNMDDSPGHFAMHNVGLRFALQWAYDLKDYEMVLPDWMINEERYDIDARAAGLATNDQMRPMLQTLLKERLQMKLHFEKKEQQVYLLTRGSGTPKVKVASADEKPSITGGPEGTTFHNFPISRFTFLLTRRMDHPVLDRTGLTGNYVYTVDLSGLGFHDGPAGAPDAPSIFTTVQRDLGLKLEPKKEIIDTLVIDHCEKVPIAN
jgi:uncharacterized protein (TIGR03435 family)